jgi:hypothetical protein
MIQPKTMGRPRLEPGQKTVIFSLRMTQSQREKLARLGGSVWLRSLLSKARVPRDRA